MGKKRNASNYVVTYPLLTKKQDEDKLNKIMEILTLHYNNVQHKMLKKWKFLINSKLYKEYVSNHYKDLSENEKKTKREEWYEVLKKNNFTEYGVDKYFKIQDGYKKNGVNSMMLKGLSSFLWKSWSQKIANDRIRIKIDNEINTISIGIVGKTFCGIKINVKNHLLTLSKHKITIPYQFQGTDYEIFAENCPMRVISITRKFIRGQYKYFLQITYEGNPYNKGRKLGKGRVGIDTSQTKMYAVYEDGKTETYSISYNLDNAKIRRLQRKLDRQRRMNNPSAYDNEGKCIVKKGEYVWVVSKNEQKTLKQLSDLLRKNAVKRKILHNLIVNEILSRANDIKVEKIQYASLAKKSKETKQNTKGKYLSKKRFGKAISSGAPSQFITILEHKTKNWEDCNFTDVKPQYACTQFDHTNGEYTKHKLNERIVILSDGDKVHRDYHAGFNIMFCNTNENVKTENSFDVSQMKTWYEEHKASIIIK